MSKNILPNGPVLALLVLLASALPGSAALAQPAPGGEVQPQQQLKPPPPPPTLRAWVEYALRARPPQDDCPLLRPDGVADPQPVCAAIVRARLEGDPRAGQLSVSLTGRSWSNNPVILPLLGPASVFSVEETAPLPGVKLAPPLLLGSVHGTDVWAARLEPGEFAFRILLRFDPRPAVELQLPGPIAELQSALSSGFLRLDETERAWHGGALQIETGHEAAAAAEEPLTVRVVRLFHWGSVPTFEYRYSLSGVREQREISLPLVGGERIETMEPDRPFRGAEGAITLTVAPGQRGPIVLRGHLEKAVPSLTKRPGLPFEHWLFVTDQRHPVRLTCDGREIDPQAVQGRGEEGVAPPAGAQAFFLTGEQSLHIEEIPVAVDEGRSGSGRISYLFVQGEHGHWVGNMSLTARLPKEDRLSVPTPAPPHYAERGGTAMRMFQDGQGVLSVQLDEQLAEGAPIRLQWRQERALGPLLSLLRLPLPSQSIHLDQQSAAAHLVPGYVAVAGLGADRIEGHLVDHFHVFALLMGLMALALLRAAKVPLGLSLVMAALFASLDQVSDFPRTPLFLLLGATAVLVRLPERTFAALRERRPLHVLLAAVWLVLLGVAVLPLVHFVQERVHSALHPWSATGSQVYADSYSEGYLNLGLTRRNVADAMDVVGNARLLADGELEADKGGEGKMGGLALLEKSKAGDEQVQAQVQQQEDRFAQLLVPSTPQPPQSGMEPGTGGGTGWLATGKGYGKYAALQAPAEKSMRPVALDQPHLPGSVIRFTYRSLLPGQQKEPVMLVAGPWLRGAWIFLEALLLIGLLYLLLRSSGPLWQGRREKAGTTTAGATAGAALAALLAIPLLLAAFAGEARAEGEGGMSIAPAGGEELDEVLGKLAELHRPTRWCSEQCAALLALRVSGRLDQGSLTFQLSGNVAQQRPALVPLFGTTPAAGISSARLDGRESVELLWSGDRYVALLPPGSFRLEGKLSFTPGRTVSFFVPGPLGLVAFDVADAQLLGDRRRRAVQGATFQLVPRAPEELPGGQDGGAQGGPQEATAASRLRFVTARSFDLGRDRRFRTVVRVEGARPGQVIPVALLAGEKVEGTEPEGASVRPEGQPRIEFTAQDSSNVFSYFGEWIGDRLALTAAEGAVRETWVVRCSDPFSCTFAGNAEVQPGATGHVWVPLPGQTLQVSWKELEPLAGVHALVQTVQLDSQARGSNLRQGMLAVWTASASVVETMNLPQGAVVTEFTLADRPVPVLRDATGAITLTLPAGRSELKAVWEIVDAGRGMLLRPPVPSFSVPVGTIRQAIHPAEGRSVLLAGGMDGSPEVRLWPAAATCLLLALLLLWMMRLLRGGRDASTAGSHLPRQDDGRARTALLIASFLGFSILSPYALLPLFGAVLGIRWMGRGGPSRHPLLVVAEVLALLGTTLIGVVLSFVVLHQAFFSQDPLEVISFAEYWGAPVIDDVSGVQLRWTAGLAGSTLPLPLVWAITVPTLALRLIWFAWALLTGLFFYREGRLLLGALAAHWARAPWRSPEKGRPPSGGGGASTAGSGGGEPGGAGMPVPPAPAPAPAASSS